ncbi:SYF2 Pre-mRNA-splicing factor SYF2 [Candida maltosa Xu316]|uniref:Pre-mRNA-splicing factor SYF2 n=1 Tax=Candida maltosa (strain Xu316) TaxID=1245528 RepID=M3J6H9_CANMX|nr:hypothetical protein G210_1938 [Candida maltosa Xu316]
MSESTLARLELLREKRKEAQKLNRQELFQDAKNQRLASLQERRKQEAKEKFEKDEYEKDEIEPKHNKPKRRINGSANVDALAESSYYKVLDHLNIDKEEYKKQKETSIYQPDSKTKSEVVTILSEVKDRRMKRRRNDNDEDVDSFINEKNKQFNMKLNRQYQ